MLDVGAWIAISFMIPLRNCAGARIVICAKKRFDSSRKSASRSSLPLEVCLVHTKAARAHSTATRKSAGMKTTAQ
ncbi:hypothetical protein HB770_28215 (plasmid) [Rhizobium leguminosarum bv. viciae]|uniref:Uncharacterized protein n=1 Tax=Rhizobium leguminosarum bv. viciae TaxID=387 RepID=A0A7G6RMT0_RHILV|nr:hypothetical protein HB770_28215 [Rhizobium leguminosarum bv. viciae]